MLYDFLKKRLAKYENDIQAIREQVNNYYQRSDMNNIEQDWQQMNDVTFWNFAVKVFPNNFVNKFSIITTIMPVFCFNITFSIEPLTFFYF